MRRFIVDAQLPPSLARFLSDEFGVQAQHVEGLGLRGAKDKDIGQLARDTSAAVLTKDQDFVTMAHTGRVPATVLLACGNVANARLQEIMRNNFASALALLDSGERVVEIAG